MRFAVEKNLPNEYTKLEYLESTGTQWIDTGIKSSVNTCIKTKFNLTNVSSTAVFGSYSGSASNGVGVFFGTAGGNISGKVYCNNTNIAVSPDLILSANTNYEIEISGTSLILNNSEYTAATTADNNYNMLLFARSNNGTIERNISGKIYYYKAYDNGTLVRDYIPALRKSDNVAGMYDKVTNTFFTSAGTGSFLYTKEEEGIELLNNPKYKQVEYLESTGTQWIDTGVIYNDNTGLDVGFSFTPQTITSAKHLIGGQTNDTRYNPLYCIVVDGSNKIRALLNIDGSTNVTRDFDTNYHTLQFNTYSDKKVVYDGVVEGIVESIGTGNSINVFRRNFSTSYAYCNGKIYYLKLYDGANIVRNFIPAIRKSDNKPGMYDTVSGTFFENKGAGEFLTGRILDPLPAKYEELAYVESTGTQYIDTGVNFDCARTAIEVKTYETSLTQIHSILGDNENNVYFFKGTNNWAAGYNKTVFRLDSYVTLGDNLFKLDKNNLYLNGNLVKTYTASTTVSSSNILLFNRKTPAVDAGPVSIYYCRIWNDGILIRDFAPCIRKSDNKVGMYDRVNGGFYTNLGTGNFTGVEKSKYKEKTVRLVKTVSNGDLPYGLTEVEYLESTGTQWIDTEYKPNPATTKIDCAFCGLSNGSTQMFGVRTVASSSSENNTNICFGPVGNKIYIRGDWIRQNSNLVTDIEPEEYVHLTAHNQTVSINGTEYSSTLEKSDTYLDYNFCLFACSTAGTVQFYNKIRQYYFKIYDNGVLVRDFVPVLDESNVPCMYDKVSKQCFYNKGTGTFTAGRKINYVDYLGSDSTAYVDTAVSGANDNLKIEMGFSYSKFTAYGYLFSNYESESANVTWFCLNGTDTDWGLAYINTRSQNGAIYTSNFIKDSFHTFVLTKTSVSIDGDIKTNNNPPVGTANTKNIILFNRGADSYYEKRDIGMRCYYFRIYDNDVLVRDFIPAMDENQVGFMFDKVTHTIYNNKGTGTFSCGDKINPFTLRLIEDVS